MSTPTMTSIARQAGVSVAVVSRLLRGDHTLRISEERRKEILRISTEVGSVKTRPRKPKLTYAIMVPASSVYSLSDIEALYAENERVKCFQARLKSHGFRMDISFFEPGEELALYKSLSRYPRVCDGIVVESGVASEKLADLMQKQRMPHVAFDVAAERFALNTVRVQGAEGLRQAVAHLHKLGHKKIGFVGPRTSHRYPLVVAAKAGLQLPLDDAFNCWVPETNQVTQENWRQTTIEPFAKWLQHRPASAVICSNDAIAYGVMDVMARHGLRPGIDLSLVGHDNLEERGGLRTEKPVLTTLDNPTDRIGHRAAELMLNQIMHGQTEIVHERLPARLIVRASTGTPV